MSNTISCKLRNDRTMSQSTEHGAGWSIGRLMRTFLVVLYPGGAYYYFFIIHNQNKEAYLHILLKIHRKYDPYKVLQETSNKMWRYCLYSHILNIQTNSSRNLPIIRRYIFYTWVPRCRPPCLFIYNYDQ